MIPARHLLLFLALSVAIAPPVRAQDSDAPIWTTQPTRIDRSRQHYERLPARHVARDTRTWLAVPQRIKVLDSVTFTFDDRVYKIAHIRPVAPKRLCQALEGGRWPCGRMGSIFLGNLVRGKRLLCQTTQGDKAVELSRCAVGSRDVGAEIVRQGYGKAEADDDLLAVQAEAQKMASKGLWRNPECVADFDGC